ncbi:MAG: UvrB/UvrC motif-containing protein [Syntrophomonas sp.]
MYCEECKERPATVHLTQVLNGNKIESHLCEQCAAQKGGLMFEFSNKYSLSNLLGSFFGSQYNTTDMKSNPQPTTCPNCGMNFFDITQTGKLGCAECYKSFEREMQPSLRKIHGNRRHVGKIPARGGEKVLLNRQIQKLKQDLQQAVAGEEYERAAQIRDHIKEIEGKMN